MWNVRWRAGGAVTMSGGIRHIRVLYDVEHQQREFDDPPDIWMAVSSGPFHLHARRMGRVELVVHVEMWVQCNVF